MLDLPLAVHLLHDKLRVHADLEVLDAVPPRFLETDDERRVFRDVVRRVRDVPHRLSDQTAFLVEERGSGACRSGIAAGSAIRVEHRALRSRKIPARRVRPPLPPDTIATTFSPGRGFTAPDSSAP